MSTIAGLKAIPKTESGVGIVCKVRGKKYQISQNPSKRKGRFTLWKITDAGYEKMQSAEDTQTLEDIIFRKGGR